MDSRTELRLYDVQDGVSKLGPGIRYVIWTQGCCRNCPGCMTPQSQPMDGGYSADVRDLADKIIRSKREGITISGGEPFLQAEALAQMISLVRARRDIGVILYTGYTYAELQRMEDRHVQRLLGQCDLLIDGAYIEALNDGKNLRGSSNQQAIPLTDRYLANVPEYGAKPAEVEFFFAEDKTTMVGVPSRDMLEHMKILFP
ncbi:MAG: radical SAM protein [Clostridiales bacterium]|nr:radical SAM protein [Clostridiales bacterium]